MSNHQHSLEIIVTSKNKIILSKNIVLGDTDIQPVKIGRSEECLICLNFPNISRYHASIFYLPNKDIYRLVDGCNYEQRSLNGVFVNNSRIEACDLKDGDIIRLTHNRFINRCEITYRKILITGETCSNRRTTDS